MEVKEIENIGLYQDGTQIVIDLQNYQFPNRCLISGEGLEAEHSPVIFYTWGIASGTVETPAKDAVKSTWWLGLIQLTGIAIRMATSKAVPGRSSLPGVFILAAGLFVSIVGTVVTIVGCILWQWPWTLVALTLVLGSIFSFVGMYILVRKNRPLKLHRFDNGFAWLAGVHPTLLVALPPWQNSQAAATYRHSRALRRLGMGGVALLIGVITFGSQFQPIVDSISSRNWQSAQGAISSAEIVAKQTETGKNKPPARTYFVAQVNYTFQVAGAVYSGSRISFGPQATYSDRRYAASSIQRQYPLGNPVTVYYHARTPARCTLRIASWREIFQSTWPSLLAFVLATWGLTTGGFLLLREKRDNRLSS